jgi:hypothetical protein
MGSPRVEIGVPGCFAVVAGTSAMIDFPFSCLLVLQPAYDLNSTSL